jgi:hypothetical protein
MIIYFIEFFIQKKSNLNIIKDCVTYFLIFSSNLRNYFMEIVQDPHELLDFKAMKKQDILHQGFSKSQVWQVKLKLLIEAKIINIKL